MFVPVFVCKMPRHSTQQWQVFPVLDASAFPDFAALAAWLQRQSAPACARGGGQLALCYPLDGTPALHQGLLQAVTLAAAESGDLRLHRDGSLFRRDGSPLGRVTVDVIPLGENSLARITTPDLDGLESALLSRLADWNLRPYLPVINRWREFALDGDIDQKGRAVRIVSGKPVFEA